MHAIELNDSHKKDFYSFLEKQKRYAIKHNKSWNLPTNIDLVEWISDGRRIYGVYEKEELVAVAAYLSWGFAPYRLLDTLTIKYDLGFSNIKKCGQTLCKTILAQCLSDKIYTVYSVGELRMWELLGFYKKGIFWNVAENWYPKKVTVVPAGNRSMYSMIDKFMGEQAYLFDMLIYKLEYDTSNLDSKDLYDDKCIAKLSNE